jgi:hypothetical protein
MLQMKTAVLPAALAVLLVTPVSWAANPPSGEINDDTLIVEWSGSGPYVFTNVTPTGGAETVICEPTVPPLCDEYRVTANISQEFRDLEENQRESVRISINFPFTTGQEDYDLYFYDAAGTLIGDSATGGMESIAVPLKTLKNGEYIVTVVPYAPMGTNYTGAVQIGKGVPKSASAFTVAPLAGSAPLTVRFDASTLAAVAPAGGYTFDFGDGSLPVTDADGVIEHTYQADGQYLARVRYSDSARGKTVAGAAQTVFVGPLNLPARSGTRLGGALGLGAILGLTALVALRRSRK